jgi:ribonuclease HIII
MSSNLTGNSVKSRASLKWIGSDESGKGDYFGPLVIAGVLVDNEISELLRKLGVKDSKRLSDNSVSKLATEISKLCHYSVVTIGPERYNELYNEIGNLNRLLAWGHSRVIENILKTEQCDYALADKFGDEKFIINALMQKGRTIELKQETKAESNMGVAAASILARAEFLRRLTMLSAKYGMDFPKGASLAIIGVGKEFVRRYGGERLKEVAKIHFRTTKSVLVE